jgi:tetratricopeptide (TPR) repeat protein
MLKRKANAKQQQETLTEKKLRTSTTTSDKLETEPWKLVFQDARQAFINNQFKEAVSLFTRALTLNPNHATLLDCRAASYEKLNELDQALRDAILIVKTAPNDARGYLRAGKLYSLQNHYEKAIRVYTRALKQVDPKDSRYPLIHNMKQAAEKAKTPPPKKDPITALPYDVNSIIFSYLSFDRRVQCTAVSRSWRNFALTYSGMWRDLEFGNRKVSQGTVKKYLQYCQGRHVRSFSIHNANRNAMKNILQSLIDENCQYIERLGEISENQPRRERETNRLQYRL